MRLSVSLVLLVVLMISGCGIGGEETKRRTRARGHRILIAVSYYTEKNQGKYPTTLNDVMPFFKSEKEFKIAMTHPSTGESPAWEYVRPAEREAEVTNMSSTAILFELVGGKRVEKGFTGYADGHMEPELGEPLTKEDLALPE